MDILSFFASAFGKVDNIAILVLLLMLGLMVWLNVKQREEDRKDREAMTGVLKENTQALQMVEKALVILSERVAR